MITHNFGPFGFPPGPSLTTLGPVAASAEIRDADDGVVIEVLEPREGTDVGFLLFWLCGWLFGEVVVSIRLLSGTEHDGEPMTWSTKLFASAWLAFWTCGGATVIYTVLKALFGRWIITIDAKTITSTFKILSFKRTRTWDTSRVRDFRLSPESKVEAGAFRFDYANETISVVPHLNSAQAKAFSSRLACLPYLKLDDNMVSTASSFVQTK